MTALEFLTRARELLATPRTWTTGAAARDAEGREVPTWDPSARQFCALGALSRVHSLGPLGFLDRLASGRIENEAANFLAGAVRGYDCVGTFNDCPTTSHADVLALFDRAIEAAAKGGAS